VSAQENRESKKSGTAMRKKRTREDAAKRKRVEKSEEEGKCVGLTRGDGAASE